MKKAETRKNKRQKRAAKQTPMAKGVVANPQPTQSPPSQPKLDPPGPRSQTRKLGETVLRWGAVFAAIVLLGGGVMINWSSKVRPFVFGVAVETDCAGIDEAFMNLIVRSVDIYQLYLIFPRGAWQECSKLRIIPPGNVLSVRQMEFEGAMTNGRRLTSGRTPLSFKDVARPIGPPAIDIDARMFGAGGARLELLIGGGIQPLNFEKFALTIPIAVKISGDSLTRVPIKIDTFGLAPEFDLGDVRPTPANRFSRIGFESLSFGRVELSELSVQFTSPWRADLRYYYNQFAIGLVFAVVGAWFGWLYARK